MFYILNLCSDEKEQLWVWEYKTNDDKHDLFMDVGEKIRFKVKEEIFVDTSPPGPTGTTSEITNNADIQRKVPYLIKVLYYS